MSQQNAQIDLLLTQASSMYKPEGYVCEQVLPEIGVLMSTGKLGTYGNSHLRIETSVKGGKGKYRRVETITRSTTSYSIEEHGLEGMVSAKDYRNVLKPFDAENDEVLGLSTMLWLEKEKSLADTLTSSSILTQYVDKSGAPTEQFNDYQNSDPLSVFNTAKSTVRSGSGAIANAMILDYAVAEMLRYHPQMLDALGFKYDRPGGLTYQELASAVGVQKIFVPNVMYNSAKEGQTDSLASVWGKHIILAVIPDKAQVRQVSLGYMVRYSDKQPRQVYKQDNFNPPGSKSILVEDNYDMLISNAAAGYLIQNAIA
jgi:hypothetical protein